MKEMKNTIPKLTLTEFSIVYQYLHMHTAQLTNQTIKYLSVNYFFNKVQDIIYDEN